MGTKMKNYIVFEQRVQDRPPQYDPRYARQVNSPPELIPYECIGAVRATDEQSAATACVKVTRRVSKYAIIEASFIDFTAELTDVEADAPQLNP